MAIDYVKIELDEDALAQMSDSDKLRFLVKIGFANYKTLKSHSDILFGNGKAGLKSERIGNSLNIHRLLTMQKSPESCMRGLFQMIMGWI